METLTEFEKIILWAAIEDFADLAWLPGELDNLEKGLDKTSLIKIAREVCRNLLVNDYVEVYKRNLNDPFCNESYKKITNQEAVVALEEISYWGLDTFPFRIYIASTEAGENAYYLHNKRT